MIKRINHTDVPIPRGSEEQAREFYCHFLGIPEIPKPASLRGRGDLWLQLGGMQVHLSVNDPFDVKKSKSHVAYEVEDLKRLQAQLEARGLEWKDNVAIPGFVRGDTRDPFGNRIEFMQPTA